MTSIMERGGGTAGKRCLLLKCFPPMVIALAAFALGAEAIRPGDTVKVAIGPAPVKVGDKTLTTLETGSELKAIAVQDAWVKVAVEKDGQKITGWINQRHLKSVAAPAPEKAPEDQPTKTPEPPQKPPDIESPVTLKVRDGELRVRFQFTTLYIPASPPQEARLGYSRFLFVTYLESGGTGHKKPVEGYFRVDGKAEKLSVRSSNEKVISIGAYGDDCGLTVSAGGPGSANITVSLAGRSVSIPMEVVAIPVNGGGFRASTESGEAANTKDEVIKILGLPDERVERYLSWPDRTFVDGIFYSASNPRLGVRIEHWKYKKYPNAVMSFKGGNVMEVRTVQKLERAE